MSDRAASRSNSGGRAPAELVAVLREKPISGLRRAVDMQIIDFGEQVPIVDRRGRPRTIGAYRLHIQSHWSLARAGVTIVTYDDILKPTSEAPDAPFDPDLGSPTLRDELLERFLAETTPEQRTVERATVTDAGGLHLVFHGGAALDVDPPDGDSGQEAWRLLLPDGTHAVMSGSGFEVVGPPPT